MKNIKSILIAAILMISFSSFAKDSINNPNSEVQKEIKSHLSVKIEHSEKVKVRFALNERGSVTQVIAITCNHQLKLEIESKFKKMHFEFLKPETVYSVMIDLKLI